MKPTDVTIRFARKDDIDAMVSLLGELFSLETDFHPDPEKQRSGLALLLQQPDVALFVAESDGNTVGMCSVQTLVSTAEGGPVGFLEDMVVNEDFRDKGIGSQLLAAAGQWVMEKGYTRLQLLADVHNTCGLEFYSRHNWQNTSLIALRKPFSDPSV